MEGLDLTTLLIFFVIFLLTLLWYYRPNSNIPGPMTWPIFGNILLASEFNKSKTRDKVADDLRKKYGPICRYFLGPYQIVLVSGYDLVSEVLHKRGKEFVNRPDFIPGIRMMRQQTTGGKSYLYNIYTSQYHFP